MKTKFIFKKNIFSNTYKIYEVDRQIGFIKRNYLSQRTIAELNGKKFIYSEKGFFDITTEIIDCENKTVGTIKYNNWNKAFLSLYDKKNTWQYENILNTRWNIKILNEKKIEYNRNGNIKADQIYENEIEILSGLYVYHYYQKAKISVMMIVFLPIFFKNIIQLIQ